MAREADFIAPILSERVQLSSQKSVTPRCRRANERAARNLETHDMFTGNETSRATDNGRRKVSGNQTRALPRSTHSFGNRFAALKANPEGRPPESRLPASCWHFLSGCLDSPRMRANAISITFARAGTRHYCAQAYR